MVRPASPRCVHLCFGTTDRSQYRSGVNLPDGRVGAPSFDDKTSSMPTFDILCDRTLVDRPLTACRPQYYPHQTVFVPPAPTAAPAVVAPAPIAPPREVTPEPETIEEELDDDHVRVSARSAAG